MLKVMIVDDEPKLREGLKSFIDWDNFGFEVVDTAANGNDALAKFAIYEPDLVIADIKMPGMDGLQLIQRLREIQTKVHILILSGFADFEYAKQAIAHRIDGYLLKPVDEDELTSHLRQIKNAIDTEQAERNWQHETREWEREAFIHSLLTEPEIKDIAAVERKAGELGLRWKSYQVLLVRNFNPDEGDGALISAILREKLTLRFETVGRGLVFSIRSYIGVLLNEPLLQVENESVYREITTAVMDTGACISAALGHKVGSIADMKQSFSLARRLLKNRFFLEKGTILTPEMKERVDADQLKASLDGDQAESLGDQIYLALEVGNLETVKSLVRRTGRALIAEGLGEGDVKRRFVEILTSILSKAGKNSPELQSKNKEYSESISDIYNARTIDGLYDRTDQFLQHMMTRMGEKGKHKEVKIMLDIIHRNFNENLKLETLSGIFNYNSAYLGKLFKNETGEYFNTYLDKVRIEKAKSYLEEGYKVYEVAEKVGYTNVDYFHAKFKKYVGTSPSAYRKGISI